MACQGFVTVSSPEKSGEGEGVHDRLDHVTLKDVERLQSVTGCGTSLITIQIPGTQNID